MVVNPAAGQAMSPAPHAPHGDPSHDAGAVGLEIADRTRLVTQRQQRFERSLAKRLHTDAPGLAVLEQVMQNGPATPSDLARRLDISTAAMTLVLDRLASAGHITREPHPRDRRKVVISPVDDSSARAQALVAPLIDGIEAIVADMGPDERAVVAGFLDAMLRVYDEVLDQDADR